MGTPNIETVIKDPEFQGLPPLEKQKVLQSLDPEYANLSDVEQKKTIIGLNIMSNKVKQEASKPLPWADVPREAASNLPESAISFGKNIIQPIISPKETIGGIRDVLFGGLGKIIPGASIEGQEEKFDAVVNFFKERYGSEEGVKRALAKDPVGVLSDFSSILMGAGGVVSKAGSVSGISGITKAGDIASKVGSAVEPLSIAGKVAAPGVKMAGEVASGTLGFTTGAGKATIQQATKGGSEFTSAMRGKVSGEDVLSNAKGALQTIKDERAATYIPRLEEISKNTNILDMTPIKETMDRLEKSFGIKRNVDKYGGETFDFSRSTINKNAVNDTEQIIRMVDDWIKDPQYQTPAGLDVLKRKLDDFYSESKNSRTLVTALRNEVKKTIIREVPEYAKMVYDYEKSSKFIDEITRTLSIGDKASADTGIRKLMSTLKDNYDFRKELIGKVDDATGGNLQQHIAGYNLSGYTPQGFMGKSFDVGILTGAFLMADPKIASAMALASPRVVGEFLNLFGKMYRMEQKIKTFTPPSVRQGAFQAGRIANTPMMQE